MHEKITSYFEIPEEARPYIPYFLTEEEIQAVLAMEKAAYGMEDLAKRMRPIAQDPEGLIKAAYSKGVFNKIEKDGRILYQAANFYKRLAYFAQYEPDVWKSIPESGRKKMDLWYVKTYAEDARPRLEEALKDSTKLIENAYFVTLEEALDVIDKLEDDPYVVPCNCKSVALNCERPQNVCILLNKGINSDWDRGHGKALSREEAKDLLRFANKNGLMQTSELSEAICNCDSCCCYPIRSSEMIGARGIWPKRLYDVVWDQEACVHCGKCAKLCNFGAFMKTDGKVLFREENCWGCTLCKSNCPTGAISLMARG